MKAFAPFAAALLAVILVTGAATTSQAAPMADDCYGNPVFQGD